MSETDQDRIKLAEAMGWTFSPEKDGHPIWIGPDTKAGDYGNYFELEELPNPFTDANDDYAVLEWMRTFKGVGINHKHWGKWPDFLKWLPSRLQDYKIGDYARAALNEIHHIL